MRNEKIEINCLNQGCRVMVEAGCDLHEVLRESGVELGNPVLGAMVNNRFRDLGYRAFMPTTVEFLDITHMAGWRMYIRSLFFLLQKAVRDTLPGSSLRVRHSVSNGYFCVLAGHDGAIAPELVARLKQRMGELVAANLTFNTRPTLTDDAIAILRQQDDEEKIRLLECRNRLYTTMYELDGLWDYFFEGLVPSTGYLTRFDLQPYHEGMLLLPPERKRPEQIAEPVPQPKMLDIFREFNQWLNILGIEDVASINTKAAATGGGEMIKVVEALHEKKLAQIADMIARRERPVRIVLVAGPSSSGKTTFAKRLAVQLQVDGLRPDTLSLDNYFVNREDTPKDENGKYDFEALGALDVEKFNDDLLALIEGREVEVPKFSFVEGKRFYDGTKLRLPEHGVLVIEGIHALNPQLTPRIKAEDKFQIYISALTPITLDGRSRISTSDNRLLRRIVRDHKYRSYSALSTIAMWESVRRGEERNIFPYQEQADVMFNSALPYELGVLKHLVEPLLREVPNTVPEHSEAQRLLKFMEVVHPLVPEEIPPTSILREFLGGSSFSYT